VVVTGAVSRPPVSASVPPAPDLDDLLTPESIVDPYPSYHRQRALGQLRWNDRWRGWVVTGHDVARRVLRDQSSFASEKVSNHQQAGASDPFSAFPAMALIGRWVSFVDPPDHTRLRRALSGAFTVRATNALEPFIQSTAEELLDGLAVDRPIDFLHEFAFSFPVTVIARLLDLPLEDAELFKRWSDDLMLIVLGAAGTADRHERAAKGLAEMADYLHAELARRKVTGGGDDVLSSLVRAQRDGEEISDDEIVAQGMILLFGGHETSTNLVANALLALDRHPEVADELRREPGSMPAAVEEFLRFDGPTKGVIRWVREPVEIDGHHLARGSRVMVLIAAANRDPAHFEHPDDFDFRRKPNDHLAFGLAAHHCLGAPLARAEAAAAIGAILRRFDVDIDRESVRWRPTMLSRSLESMSVTLHPRG
jgi:cytochrome P450